MCNDRVHLVRAMPLPESTDELDELTLARARRGDETACRQLFRCYRERVHALLWRMRPYQAPASFVEDLLQDTFLRVFRGLPQFEPSGAARLSTWIFTIATRVALNELRRKRPERETLDEVRGHASDVTADRDANRRELGRAIERAVAELPPEYRAAFLLREVHGLSYDELCSALEVELGTVKSRLARGREALRHVLEEAGYG